MLMKEPHGGNLKRGISVKLKVLQPFTFTIARSM